MWYEEEEEEAASVEGDCEVPLRGIQAIWDGRGEERRLRGK